MTGDPSVHARAVPHPGDDALLPFRTVRSGVEGRIVRLAAVAEEILGRHAYPEPVSRTLGEALALVAMLGAPLKPGGRLVLETRTDGPLRSLAVNYEHPGRLRGYAGFDRERTASPASLLGSGHLAMTIEPGAGDSYQGIVAVDAGTSGLAQAAETYFAQSEGLPTFLRLVVARELAPEGVAAGGNAAAWRWRVGGLMLQHPEAPLTADGDETESEAETPAEHWRRVRMLAETVEDHELIDPLLAPERLLYRLFHEEGVRVRAAVPLSTFCRCSDARIIRLMSQFGAAELAELKGADGRIGVTCEFCGRTYTFDPEASAPPDDRAR